MLANASSMPEYEFILSSGVDNLTENSATDELFNEMGSAGGLV
jgi:hypothetical protein